MMTTRVTKNRIAKLLMFLSTGILIIPLVACSSSASSTESGMLRSANPVTREDLEIVVGQTLYVPAYSEIIINDRGATVDLTIMLSIHNSDLNQPILIESIAYYDSDGILVKEYIDTVLELNPMAATEIVIPGGDKHGGTGANFLVRWGAEQAVHVPVVEAVMTDTSGQQGLSFISSARVLEEIKAN